MNLRVYAKVSTIVSILGVASAFASYSRVESMGKNSTYIMDDISIFDNPANINIYPNYLIGEMGVFTDDLQAGSNSDPQHPWFGGIFSLALGKEDSRDPRLSIAGAFNRVDENLFRFLPDSVRYVDNLQVLRSAPVPSPVTNFDGFLGGTTPEGNAIGVHIYVAAQDGAVQNGSGYTMDPNAFAALVRADAGVNWQFSTDVDGEFTAGVARVQYGPDSKSLFDSELFSLFLGGRLFSTIEAINGELVPAANYSFVQAPGIDESKLVAGLGVNVALDRGFFWLGVDYVNVELRTHDWLFNDATGVAVFNTSSSQKLHDVRTENGGQISFGIERNIFWDWFVIRVGGKKVITYVECDRNANQVSLATLCPQDGNYFYSNPVGDGSMDDHVGFGFGINVEEKLKIDATVAEDVLYRNPFQGPGRLLSRVSATYSF